MDAFAWLILIALISVELLRSVPAWLQVHKTRSTAGLSAISIGVLAGSSSGWLAVALLAAAIPALAATCVWLVFHLLLCREALKADRSLAKPLALGAGISAAAVGVATLTGFLLGSVSIALGLALGAATVAYALPGLVAGMRSATTSGLSIVSLSVNTIEGLIYLCGGIGAGGITPVGTVTLAYILFGFLSLLSNLPRLVRVLFRRVRGLDQMVQPVVGLKT